MTRARITVGTTVLALVLATTGCSSGSTAVIATSATSATSPPVGSRPSGTSALPILPETMDAGTFSTWMATPGIVVIDVRTPSEFAAGHLPRAKNLDVQSSGFTGSIEGLSRSAAYLLYCQSGSRSAQAFAAMKKAGFVSVGQLSGGIRAWQASGGKVVTG